MLVEHLAQFGPGREGDPAQTAKISMSPLRES
jgi:hypothetical protein